ncbi:hypothetical protein HanHA300_Chr05g0165521 [Helianthus annuus]|nr:hypothetical protein HanHA300_Chr05g0165521 [Helianthus annuus]KAJ0583689.1 hypothetical protein HanHA89_Chr05g0179551 [Helianthus annuus]KAJ0749418.1 hypothetical protein HanLR1_Chr05g0169631 [Helianthus annuus]
MKTEKEKDTGPCLPSTRSCELTVFSYKRRCLAHLQLITWQTTSLTPTTTPPLLLPSSTTFIHP